VYQTLAGEAPMHMMPHIRNILGGFLFSGDDIDKPVRVLSGGERTRLAVARMLLRPSNTLLLDEPTNHLDLDSKDVLLEALEDFGGTLIFVSHDRYFVDKLATKVIDIGSGQARLYPGTYEEFLWSQKNAAESASRLPALGSRPGNDSRPSAAGSRPGATSNNKPHEKPPTRPTVESREPRVETESYDQRKQREAEARKLKKAEDARRRRVEELEAKISDREAEIKKIEAQMSAPGFYENHQAAKPVVDRHQTLMWEVGDLMGQWESLQEETPSS
jgi:ATP-binding cassette, subfamily F, member 3